jgi:hypothetical protein
VQAAQAKLQQSKEAKKRSTDSAAADEDDDLYVYLPPGSSMRDPVSLPNSMSDPLDNRKVCRERRRAAAKNWLAGYPGWLGCPPYVRSQQGAARVGLREVLTVLAWLPSPFSSSLTAHSLCCPIAGLLP